MDSGSLESDRSKAVREIQELIGGTKDVIIPSVRNAIHQYISSQSRVTCLTVVGRDNSGTVLRIFSPGPPDLEYVRVLTAFVFKRGFNGYSLDSALSDPTAVIVAHEFSKHIAEISDDIADRLLPFLIHSDLFRDNIVNAIADAYKSTIPHHLQARVTSLLSQKLKAILIQHVDAGSVAAVKVAVTKLVAASVSSPLAAKITLVLLKTLATSLKPIIVKLLASAAFKTAILAKIKVVVLGSMLGAFIKLLAAKIGLTGGTVFALIVLPLLVAWLAYEAVQFPNKLAEKVSADVAADLEGRFSATSKELADSIIEMAILQASSLVAKELLSENAVADLINEILEAAKRSEKP